MAKKQSESDIDQLQRMSSLIGLDGTEMVLDMLEEGKTPEEIHRATQPFIKRHCEMSREERRAHAARMREGFGQLRKVVNHEESTITTL